MEPLFLIIALVAILPIALFVVYCMISDSASGSGFWEVLSVIGFFFIMAFVFYRAYSPSDDSMASDSGLARNRTEYVKKENSLKHEPAVESKDSKTERRKPVIDSVDTMFFWQHVFVGIMTFPPVALYMMFIIGFDSKKPEPFGILLLATFIGSVLAAAASYWGYTLYDSGLSIYKEYSMLESLKVGFLRIAVPSEVLIWIFLLVFLSLNKYYDEYLDGIVYSVCLSMGFACILYVGFMLHFVGHSASIFYPQGIVTALITLPLNVIVGSIMGYFIALTKHRNKFLNYAISLILPIIVSGLLYSVLALIGDQWGYYFLFVMVITPLAYVVYSQIRHLLSLEESYA